MPKQKTNSSAKKRYSFTGTGKVRMNPANKRHKLARRPKDMKRQTRGTETLKDMDAKKVKRFLMPYGDKFQ
jgi:large subunit ribosomal protein L35